MEPELNLGLICEFFSATTVASPITLAGIGNKMLHLQRTVHVIIIFNTEKTVEIIISNTLPGNILDEDTCHIWQIASPLRLAGIGNKTLHVRRTAHVIIIFNTEKTVQIIISNTLIGNLPTLNF